METKLHPILEQELVKGVEAGWVEMCDRVISTTRSFIYGLFMGCIMVSKSHFLSFYAQQFLVGLTFSALALAPLRPDRHRKGSRLWACGGLIARSPGVGAPRPGCEALWL